MPEEHAEWSSEREQLSRGGQPGLRITVLWDIVECREVTMGEVTDLRGWTALQEAIKN